MAKVFTLPPNYFKLNFNIPAVERWQWSRCGHSAASAAPGGGIVHVPMD
jgi:hypothetical protein